jgi:PAS domain S-box-containing protein
MTATACRLVVLGIEHGGQMDISRKAKGAKEMAKGLIVKAMNRGHEQDAYDGAAESALAAIVEYSEDAIISSTLDGIIRTWNRGAENIFGYTATEIVGRPDNTIIPLDRQDEEPKILELLKAEQRVGHFETTRIAQSGRIVDVAVTISPIKDSRGNMIAFSTSTRDITAQKHMQRELRLAKESAEAASKAKDHFLSVLSHELRTPLTPVLAEISYLETQLGLPPEFLQHIGMIRRNLELEARLVDDLLDLTRIRRQKICLHYEVVDVHQMLRNAIEMVQSVIDTKSIDAAVSLRANRHDVWGDPDRLQQVFMNLLSNAAKFTPKKGLITVRTSNVAGARIRIEVGDNGIGIETDMLFRLFNAFEQTDRTRRYGGLGLGLSIAKSLVELHQGTITAVSDGPDLGAMFAVELETVTPAEPAPARETVENAAAPGCRILFVEDHDDTRRVMERLLIHIGCDVTSAGSVQEALSIGETEPFDLLVSDLGLPDGCGAQIMEELKSRTSIRGIAISGLGEQEDLRRSREAGFEMHLIKPINFATLKEAIIRMSA